MYEAMLSSILVSELPELLARIGLLAISLWFLSQSTRTVSKAKKALMLMCGIIILATAINPVGCFQAR
jgi:hypothetical protein